VNLEEDREPQMVVDDEETVFVDRGEDVRNPEDVVEKKLR
jgi:hypothetical protein